jgi:drug/metabolite transporter (DMT)-like permease
VIDPYWLTLLRYGIAALCFCAVLAAAEGPRALRLDGKLLKLLVFGTVGFAGFSIIVFEGLRFTRPEHAAMILALQPVIIVFYQWARTGTRPRPAVLACIALALLGEALVITQGQFERLYTGGSSLGNLLILLSALCWVSFTLGAQAFPGWSPVRYTALASSFGWLGIATATALASAAGHSAPPAAAALRDIAWALVFIVFVVSFAAVLFWSMAVAKLGPLNASLFANFAPVVTIFITVWQGHRLLPMEWAGAALVIAALIGNNLIQRRHTLAALPIPQRSTSP